MAEIAPCKRIQDSLGFWIHAVDSGFFVSGLASRLRIPVVGGILDSSSKNVPRILEFRFLYMGRYKCYFKHAFFLIISFEREPATSLGPAHKEQVVCL